MAENKVVMNDLGEQEKLKGSIEIDLEKKPKAQEPKYVTLEDLQRLQDNVNKAIESSRHYTNRKLEDFYTKTSKPNMPIAKAPNESKDNLDELLEQGNWRTPVETVAEKAVEKALAKQRDEEALKAQEAKRLDTLERSKASVTAKYPDIEDQKSEVAQRYMKILNEHPEYLSNEFGPVLAMRDMEDNLRQEGRLDEFTKKKVAEEVERRTRTNASSIPKSSGTPSSSGKVVLTKEDRELCDRMGIRYEDYARNRKVSETQSVEA